MRPPPQRHHAWLALQTAASHFLTQRFYFGSLGSKNGKWHPSMGIFAMNNLSARKELVISMTRSIWHPGRPPNGAPSRRLKSQSQVSDHAPWAPHLGGPSSNGEEGSWWVHPEGNLTQLDALKHRTYWLLSLRCLILARSLFGSARTPLHRWRSKFPFTDPQSAPGLSIPAVPCCIQNRA